MNESFGLKVVLEGLNLVCASPQQRAAYFQTPDSLLDENFDFIVLDYLEGLLARGVVLPETVQSIQKLFKEADSVLSEMDWQEEDRFLAKNSELVRSWKVRAQQCISQIEIHHKKGM